MARLAAFLFLLVISLLGLGAVEITQGPPLPAEPNGLLYAPLGDGRVLMTNFRTTLPITGDTALPLTIAYDPVANTYQTLANTLFLSSFVDYMGVDHLGNVFIHRMSGKSERYLRHSDQWQEISGAIVDGMAAAFPMQGSADSWAHTIIVSQYGSIWKLLTGSDVSWLSIAPRPVALSKSALCWGGDGCLYAFNGQYPSSYSSAACHRYDPSTNSWTTLSNSPNARDGATALPMGSNQFILVGGGSNSDLYSTETNQWRTVDSLTSFVYGGNAGNMVMVTGPLACRLPNNRILGNTAYIEPGWTNSRALPVNGPSLHPVYAGNGKLVWCGNRPITWDLKATISPAPVSTKHDTSVLINLAAWTHAFDPAVLYEVVAPPQNGQVQFIATTLMYSPNPGFTGTDTFSIRAKDPTFGVGSAANIAVTVTNTAPTITTGIPFWSQPQGASWSGSFTASDADNDQLTWRSANCSPGLSLNFPDSSVGAFVATLDPADIGQKTALVVVSDSCGASATFAIWLDILPVNTAPSFTPGPPLVAYVGQNEISIPGWASDIRTGCTNAWESAQTVTFSTSCTSPGLFLAQPSIRPNGDLVFTPSPAAFGSCTLSVTIVDSGGTQNGGQDRTTIAGIPVDIRYRNQPPSATFTGSVTAWGPQRFEMPGWLSGIRAGPANPTELLQRVSISCQVADPGLFAELPTIDDQGRLTLRLVDGPSATAALTVILRDDGGTADGGVDCTVLGPVNLDLVSVNHPPTISATDAFTVTEQNVPHSIDLGISCSVGPAWEGGQTVERVWVESNDHPGLFSVQPHMNGSRLEFQPAHNLDQDTIVTVAIRVQDSGGTANGGVDTSPPFLVRITMTTVQDTLVVQNNLDAGPGSFRECLAAARSGDTICFDPVVFSVEQAYAATVINLTTALPPIVSGHVTIDARGRRVMLNGAAAGSSDGLVFSSDRNVVAGLSIVGFSRSGILVTGGYNHIGLPGGRVDSSTLRLANNGSYGIRISGPAATGNIIRGCWIGLGADGIHAEPNLAGIILEDGASSNVIGGDQEGEGNLVSGNTLEGITCVACSDNIILGNSIGLGVDDRPCGNGASGVFISRGASRIRIGSRSATDDSRQASNRIACNGRSGLEIRSAAANGNHSLSNRYWGNLLAGISLFDAANAAVTPPSITAVNTATSGNGRLARAGADGIQIAGRAAAKTGLVELYATQSGQGERLLGRAAVADGQWSLAVPIPTEPRITATFTDPSGNTSEFSAPSQLQETGNGDGTAAAGSGTASAPIAGTTMVLGGGGSNGCGLGGLATCLLACMAALVVAPRCRMRVEQRS